MKANTGSGQVRVRARLGKAPVGNTRTTKNTPKKTWRPPEHSLKKVSLKQITELQTCKLSATLASHEVYICSKKINLIRYSLQVFPRQ